MPHCCHFSCVATSLSPIFSSYFIIFTANFCTPFGQTPLGHCWWFSDSMINIHHRSINWVK
ncbi:hypothetical protein ES332_D13G091700v1 [Gossypium tomentosum]|uniref:Uncharacterized protein n=1 Tax=Gossypium tomentosum TaxID=34277 RepID=A0A5D2HVY6_GOSTO|nr:hypothetical protein ES332_D13G091700v1 [Gossypium tomentosum]